MSKYEQAPCQIGSRYLLPGIQYTVVREFRDVSGNTHPAGETWTFLGWNLSRGYANQFIVRSDSGAESMFSLSYRQQEQSVVLANFENYVAGVSPSAAEIINGLSEEGRGLMARLGDWARVSTGSGEKLLLEIKRAAENAWIADDRAGYIGNPYEAIEKDLRSLENECLGVLSKIVQAMPKNSLQARRP